MLIQKGRVMVESKKRSSGRPRKSLEDKVQYQRIAIYKKDYDELLLRIARKSNDTNTKIQIIDVISQLIKKYK